MTDQMLIVFGVLAGAVVLFAWGRPRADIVAILVVLALMLSRVLTPQESLAGFGDPVVILIAAIFIVGEALVNDSVQGMYRVDRASTYVPGARGLQVI